MLTVHDLSFEHRAADFSRYERVWHRLARPRRLARRADRVIAVSESGAGASSIAEWGAAPEKVVTVAVRPGRPSPRPRPATPAACRAHAGLRARRRGPRAAQAPRPARRGACAGRAPRGSSAELVFAGEGPLREQLAGSGATVLGYVPDEQLDVLYRDALALACVSREEGFAFTPLEALARGTPAVVSDLPVFARRWAPAPCGSRRATPTRLAAALLRVERDHGRERELVEARARAPSARLSWERAAARTRAGAGGARRRRGR